MSGLQNALPFDAVYYINLGRRPDRRRTSEAQLAHLGWSDYRRVEAVDSVNFRVEDWVRRGAVAERTDSPYSPGVLACIASHYLVWTEILESPAEDDAWFLILEDDFRVHPILAERPEIWRAYWEALPPGAGFVFVGCTYYQDPELLDVGETVNQFVVRLKQQVFSSHAYALTAGFVRTHFSQYFPLEYPFDYFFFKLPSLYAFRPIEDRRWACRTPSDFYLVERRFDEDTPLWYTGLISVHASPSDIHYYGPGVEAKLNGMIDLMSRGEHDHVCRLAREMNATLMRQLHPDLYLSFLDIAITSFWYVKADEGLGYVRQLLASANSDRGAREFFRNNATRLVGNLRCYAEEYAHQGSALLRGPGVSGALRRSPLAD